MPTSPTPPGSERFPQAVTVDDFRANLAAVRARITAAAERTGRRSDHVRLLPVSKTVPEDRVRLAIAAGCSQLGENKVQEAKRKCANLADLDVAWSVIGHLQTNKARDVAAFATEFQALDSLRLAEALDRRLHVIGRRLDVYIQVNTSAEESKFGLDPLEVPGFLRQLPAYPALRVRGFMTLALFSNEAQRVRQCFRMLRQIRDHARDTDPDLIGPGELSMGMSGDFEVAVEEGADCVRVGQAIFGARSTPDDMYWPTPAGKQISA
ncbi:MAG: YggS family pyridoxal phosphate-dependent enzyme [Arachnia sp.]